MRISTHWDNGCKNEKKAREGQRYGPRKISRNKKNVSSFLFSFGVSNYFYKCGVHTPLTADTSVVSSSSDLVFVSTHKNVYFFYFFTEKERVWPKYIDFQRKAKKK